MESMAKADKKRKSSVRSTIFRIIVIVVAGVIVGFSAYSWNAQRLVGNQLPMPFGVGASVVLTGSMEPVLHTNDLVIVTEQEAYHVDDIVVYQDGNILVIHRVIDINEEQVLTKGDANNIADSPVSLTQIKGKMIFRIPYIGFVVKILKSVPGTLIVIALAIFLMYRSRRKEKDVDNAEMDEIVAEIRRLQEQQSAVAAADAQVTPPTAESLEEASTADPSEAEPESDSPAAEPDDSAVTEVSDIDTSDDASSEAVSEESCDDQDSDAAIEDTVDEQQSADTADDADADDALRDVQALLDDFTD